ENTEPPPPALPSAHKEINLSIGFTDLNESLNELEDNDLDALMNDLIADLNASEVKLAAEIEGLGPPSATKLDLPAPKGPVSELPSPPSPRGGTQQKPRLLLLHSTPSPDEIEAQIKAEKIKLALEKLKEAKVKKLVVKVMMDDGSAKTLMVDERQNVREVMENMFEKTHCDCNVNWSLCETNHELQLERFFEDHENMVEPLLAWTRDTENQVLFKEMPEKYEVFKNPQNFYLWKKDRKTLRDMKDKDKEILIKENFCGTSTIVPDLEGVLHLKEDGKKSWKQRLFQLRASGIYYVPKGKTKSSRDLVCFVQFDNVNVYYGQDCKSKYKAPTDFCFVLKHPQIQKESQYIKYVCCDDETTMKLWVTGIRIAKFLSFCRPRTSKVSRPLLPSSPPHSGHAFLLRHHWAPNILPSASSSGCQERCQTAPKAPEAIVSSIPHTSRLRRPLTFPTPSTTQRRAPPDFLPPPPPAASFLPSSSLNSMPLPPPPAALDLPPPPPDPEFLPPPPPMQAYAGTGCLHLLRRLHQAHVGTGRSKAGGALLWVLEEDSTGATKEDYTVPPGRRRRWGRGLNVRTDACHEEKAGW
uniref:Amyloid beta A4 precursor protein-binding family B member 1-interacting protein n=1 Tax=Neogobius melanostomus TaxID=47308 RepID=A0A8C6TLW1_9GOBI